MAIEKIRNLLGRKKVVAVEGNTPALPATGYLRLHDVIGCPRLGKPALIPIGRSTLLNGVKSGKYKLTPVHLSERCVAYAVDEVRDLIASFATGVK